MYHDDYLSSDEEEEQFDFDAYVRGKASPDQTVDMKPPATSMSKKPSTRSRTRSLTPPKRKNSGSKGGKTTVKKKVIDGVKTYAQIRIIGHLDQVVVNSNFKNDDYLRMKKQEIENKHKQDLIEFIRPINSR